MPRLRLHRLVVPIIFLVAFGLSALTPDKALATPDFPGSFTTEPAIRRAPGQIIIKVKPGVNLANFTTPAEAPPELAGLIRRLGVRKITPLGGTSRVFLLNFGGDVDRALELARAVPAVEKVGDNRILKASLAEISHATELPVSVQAASPVINDPLYTSGAQWWLDKISAPQAWQITTGSKSVKVGVVDSGVSASHPELKGKVIANYNFANESSQSAIVDEHGTAVAGCITANTNNGMGIGGIAWDVSLIDGQGFGESEQGYSFDLVRGNLFAIDNGARVINNSWGGGSLGILEVELADYALKRNVTLVFSSGNSGFNQLEYPAGLSLAYPNVIAVGATDIKDRVVGFSTYGRQVSVVAPGSGIWTLGLNGGYTLINGTSFSAPIVTGVIALMLSANPKLTPRNIRDILEGTADDIGAPGYDLKAGYGRINAYQAVKAAKEGRLTAGKQSTISGNVTGVAPDKVVITLEPLQRTVRPAADGTFSFSGLGKGNYYLRAVVSSPQGNFTASLPAIFVSGGDTVSQVDFNLATVNVYAKYGDEQTINFLTGYISAF